MRKRRGPQRQWSALRTTDYFLCTVFTPDHDSSSSSRLIRFSRISATCRSRAVPWAMSLTNTFISERSLVSNSTVCVRASWRWVSRSSRSSISMFVSALCHLPKLTARPGVSAKLVARTAAFAVRVFSQHRATNCCSVAPCQGCGVLFFRTDISSLPCACFLGLQGDGEDTRNAKAAVRATDFRVLAWREAVPGTFFPDNPAPLALISFRIR